MNRSCLLICCSLGLFVFGCTAHKEPTATSGKSVILVSEVYAPVVQTLATDFSSLYPQAQFDVHQVSTREAIVHLLNDSVTVICIDRPLNDEERQVAAQASKRLQENRLADDGIALLVHRDNATPFLTQASVQKILAGTTTAWTQCAESKESGPVDVVVTGKNSGLYELLKTSVVSSAAPLATTAIVATQHEVVEYVAHHPQAIGFISASAAANHPATVKVLPIEVRTEEGTKERVFPGQTEIHKGLYPYRYSLYLYTAEEKVATGSGFTAFVLSYAGQRSIQKAGLVPAKIPSRTIQLTAE